MFGHLKSLARCANGSTMIEYAALVAVLMVIGYFVYDGLALHSRRIVADSGSRIDASWKRAVRPGMTVIRSADREDPTYSDLERRYNPAAGRR